MVRFCVVLFTNSFSLMGYVCIFISNSCLHCTIQIFWMHSLSLAR